MTSRGVGSLGRPPTVEVTRRHWRVLSPRWAYRPLSGDGATKHGGRFNPPGVAALYMSETFETAVAEYEQELGIRPGTLCAYDVRIDGIADLTDAAVLAALDLDRGVLASPWKQIALVDGGYPPTWTLVDRLIARSVRGVRVPSMRAPSGVNLVLWRWNDGPRGEVAALDPLGDLPRDQSSWPSA